jgi:hypothetical protein
METTYFEETQNSQWGTLIVPALIAVLFGVIFIVQVVSKTKVGSRPAPSWLLLLIFLVFGSLSVFMSMQSLRVRITGKAIYFSYGAFSKERAILISQISSLSLRKYDGAEEFAGWGVKTSSKEDCFTVSGDEGLEVTFKSSSEKPILIGTKRSDDLKGVLSRHFYSFQKATF